MYTRAVIQDGDKTTHNGDIQARYNGVTTGDPPKNICFQGDPVICPVCKTTGFTKCVPPFRPNTGHDGRQINLDGDLCICRCSPPPRLKASSTTYVVEFWGHEISGLPGAIGWLQHNGQDLFEHGITHNQHFQLIDETSGEYLANVNYELECNGEFISGKTDAEGFTDLVYSKGTSPVNIYIKGIE